MKYLLTAFCALCLFSCSDDDKPEAQPAVAERTVIIYISAENSLSSFAPSDLSEITVASKSIDEKNHLVVFYDNSSKTSLPFIAEVKKGEVVTDRKKVFDEDFYASDPEKMRDILAYIMEAYPARSYAIDLWGHSSGWFISNDSVAVVPPPATAGNRAYGIDNGNNTTSDYGKWLNIPSMAKVFSSLPNRFTYIMADCCFFQCVETAYELKDCTDYIIGSPSEVPGTGAAYSKVIPLMFSTSADFYVALADKWAEYSRNGSNALPLSVIKTSGAERFAYATSKIMPDLLKYDNFTKKRLLYYGRYPNENGITAYYDPMNLAGEYAKDNPALQEWKEALKEFVVYSVMADRWLENTWVDFSSFDVNESTFSGVSMFVPQPMYESLNPNPNNTIHQFKWAKAVGL